MTATLLDLDVPNLYNGEYYEHLLDMPSDDLGICIEHMAGNSTYELFLDFVRKSETEPSSILDAYKSLPEMQTKLFFVIDMWKNQKYYPNFKKVWSIIFREIYQGGILGGLLFQAKLKPQAIEAMHLQTSAEYLMNEEELVYFNNLPAEVEIWRLTGPDTRTEWKGAYWFSSSESANAHREISMYTYYSKILHGKVKKENIMGVFSKNKVLILKPGNTKDITKINSVAI